MHFCHLSGAHLLHRALVALLFVVVQATKQMLLMQVLQ